ncbi:hypothetical protein D918_02335 [Trichuris suis]|nr:hypothetical protein D918_02335 [Trichuris suis]
MQKRTLKSMISSLSKPNADGLLAFYRISLLIAKGGMPHAIGKELMIPAIAERYKLCLKNAQARINAA